MLAWLLVGHVLGLALWVAGVFGAGRIMIDHARAGGAGPLAPAARRLILVSGHGGMTVVLVTGGLALTVNPSYYLGEAWMWAKLAAAALGIAATVVLTVHAKRLAESPSSIGEKPVKLWRGLFMGAVAAALVFVFVKPL